VRGRQFVEVAWDGQRIVCYLPITLPTGRVRVKRCGQPLATRQVKLQWDDVIEWQIAYRDDKGKPVELGQILSLARKHGILQTEDVMLLREFAETQRDFCDERLPVITEPTEQEFRGFRLHWRKHPVWRCEVGDEASVEIELRHRQRALGFQAMIFLLIPLSRCEPTDIVGRSARPKEKVQWTPSRDTLTALVKAFTIATQTHRDDMLKLLRNLAKEGWMGGEDYVGEGS